MQYWKDDKEPIAYFLKMLEAAIKEKEMSDSLKKLNQLIQFDYTEDGPDCAWWWDTRGGEIKYGAGKAEGPPDLVMSLSADDAHRSWSNKLNPVIAITRKKIRVKGSATGLLKLAPKLKKVAEIYERVLRAEGRDDLVLT